MSIEFARCRVTEHTLLACAVNRPAGQRAQASIWRGATVSAARSGVPGGGGDDPADPGCRRVRSCAAAGVADVAAVPGNGARVITTWSGRHGRALARDVRRHARP